MRIFNIMISRDLGGVQQAFLDYDVALRMHDHDVINISSIGAKINHNIPRQLSCQYIKLPMLTLSCWLSKMYLKILITRHKPNIIIAHCVNSINLLRGINLRNTPLVGVAHNYTYQTLKKCNHVIATTEGLKEYMQEKGYDHTRVFQVPNMLQIRRQYKPLEFKKTIVIGAMGRFVPHKNFADLIKAISILKKNGHNIKLLLAGDGNEEKSLKNLSNELGLESSVSFLGWITDKDDFFQKIDIFCLPSTHEPFGIVLLEAMEHSKPIVSTRCVGPHEILSHNQDALLTKKSSVDIAEKLSYLINNPNHANKYAESAYKKLSTNYDINLVSKQLSDILSGISKYSKSSYNALH